MFAVSDLLHYHIRCFKVCAMVIYLTQYTFQPCRVRFYALFGQPFSKHVQLTQYFCFSYMSVYETQRLKTSSNGKKRFSFELSSTQKNDSFLSFFDGYGFHRDVALDQSQRSYTGVSQSSVS